MTGINASDHPAALYRQLTIGSSGVSYVIAVWCAFQLGRRLGLPVLVCALLAASLAFGTIALPYSRAVNDHILSLAIAALLTLIVAGTADVARERATGADGGWQRAARSPGSPTPLTSRRAFPSSRALPR